MRLPASVLGVLKLGVVTAIALPGCDVIAEAQSAPSGEEASVEAAAPVENTPVVETRTPERDAIVVAEASPGGLGREVTSALERARIAAPIERAPLVEDPTVIVPFSEDPSRVEPIRAREKTPKPIARPRVRPRPAPVAVAPVIVVPKNWDSCPACGRG
jgi:hypothetical protein